MPVTFQCEECHQTTSNPDGWLVVQVNFMHHDATLPGSGLMLESTAPLLYFDKPECRDEWCTQAGLVSITQPK